jgi:hypothetical protein
LLPDKATAAVPASTGGHSDVAAAPDADFEACWAAWRTRGIAHEQAVRRKLILVAGVAGTVVTAAAMASTLLQP